MLVFPGPCGASVVYQPDTLTEEERAAGIAVEALPPKDTPEGKVAQLWASKDGEEGRVWWEYVDPPEPEPEE